MNDPIHDLVDVHDVIYFERYIWNGARIVIYREDPMWPPVTLKHSSRSLAKNVIKHPDEACQIGRLYTFLVKVVLVFTDLLTLICCC